MEGCRGRLWSGLGRAVCAAVAGCHVETSWQRRGESWAKSERKWATAERAEPAAVGRVGRGGSQREGLVLPAGCEGTGDPFAPVGQRNKCCFTSCRDSARCSGPGVRAKEEGAQRARVESIGRRRKRGGKKNISKSEK